MKTTLPCSLLLLFTATAHAGPRASASYNVPTDTADAGGKRATSTSYTHDGSLGGVAGLSTVASPSETVKSGYIGQLYDVIGLLLNAATLTVNEGTTDQLSASQTLDDATLLAVPATSVAWSVASGPLTGINASGLATAGVVFQNTAASAQGIYLGNTGSLALTVNNVNPDNFGSYAGDTLDDDWQNLYFGLNNPLAAPAEDPDKDGRTNRTEFLSGFVPTDPTSFLQFTTQGFSSTTVVDFRLNKVIPGRTYTVKANTDLTTPPTLVGIPFSVAGEQTNRLFQDPAATEPRKFYFLEISKP